MKALTKEQVVEKLRQGQGALTQTEYARAIGVSPAYLSDVYHSRREPGPAILRALRLRPAFAPLEECTT